MLIKGRYHELYDIFHSMFTSICIVCTIFLKSHDLLTLAHLSEKVRIPFVEYHFRFLILFPNLKKL